MQIKTIFFLSLFSIITFSNCKKYIGDYDANYIGEWHSDTLQNSAGHDVEVYLNINGRNSEYDVLCELN